MHFSLSIYFCYLHYDYLLQKSSFERKKHVSRKHSDNQASIHKQFFIDCPHSPQLALNPNIKVLNWAKH